VETQSYGEFSAGLHAHLDVRRIPLNGTVEITRRCPLNCIHCYNNLPMNDVTARNVELSFAEHCRILDEMVDAGCLWLLYTGGEIFARSDFPEIYSYAKRRGLLVTLFTNGNLLTPAIADSLAAWPPFSVEITMYGRTQATYESLARIPGSYAKCMRAIRLLVERGLPLTIKTAVVTVNKKEIWDLKRFVEQDLGLPFKFDAMMNPRIDCTTTPLTVRLTPAEIIELDLLDSTRIAEWRSFCRRFQSPVQSHSNERYHCGGGISSFAIDPEGKMSLCVLSRSDTYDLRNGSFGDAWENFLGAVRRRKTTRRTKCVSCSIKAMCGMCPANGELECADPEIPVDFLCHVAHLRARVLEIPVRPHGRCDYCEGGARCEDLKRQAARLQEKRCA
jgi:radical SAM protein with 4Fe4S-binding SPASM domain